MARAPEIRIDQPDRFENSVARSIRARMRSMSRAAPCASSYFVIQSTLMLRVLCVKRIPWILLGGLRGLGGRSARVAGGRGLLLGAGGAQPAVLERVDQAGHRAGEPAGPLEVRGRRIGLVELVVD